MKPYNSKHYHKQFENKPNWYLKTVTTLITKFGLEPKDIKMYLEDIVEEDKSYKSILKKWGK